MRRRRLVAALFLVFFSITPYLYIYNSHHSQQNLPLRKGMELGRCAKNFAPGVRIVKMRVLPGRPSRGWSALVGTGRSQPVGPGRHWSAPAGTGRNRAELVGAGRDRSEQGGDGRHWPGLAGTGRGWAASERNGRRSPRFGILPAQRQDNSTPHNKHNPTI